nr:putative zinc finger, CCHC-type [Tanacetum cinerariifolium]
MSEIEPLTGTNFSTLRDQVKLTLGVMDLDHALRIDPPATLTAESTADQKRTYEQWKRSNRMSLMIIKNSISVAIRGAIPDSENAKEYLSFIEEQFKRTSKAHASTLILKMLTIKYDGVSGVREHIMMMSNMANKLKGIDMEISEGFLVHFIMTSLHMQFVPFKINYNTQKEKWKMSEQIAMCVQEEEHLKVKKSNIVHVATTNSNKRKGSWKGKGSSKDNSTPNKLQKIDASTSSIQGGPKCEFCHKKWHTQKDCPKFKEWSAKKGKCNDPESFEDAITCGQSAHWREAMEDELNSMSKNNVWEFAKLPKGANPLDASGSSRPNLTQMGILSDTKLVWLRKELHQMDVKNAFLNGDLHEDVYMAQPQGFRSKGQEHLVCKLKKSIYEIKQASRQWYLKFDEVMKKHNFIKNQVDQCVYLKMSGSNFIIFVLYVDDILLASNDIDLLHESKCFLSRNFDMKYFGKASYVIGIKIHRDRANGKLGLSQKAYIERALNRFNMQHCSPTVALIIKSDVFGSHQCPKTEVEYEEMKRIHYASVVGFLMYAQVCTRPDIAYICGMLGGFQSNPGLLHWKAAKKTLRNADTSRSTSGYIFMLSGGPISWKSKNQVLTTTSTMMAKYVSVYSAICYAMLLRNLITGLKIISSISRPLKIYCDNSAAVSFSNRFDDEAITLGFVDSGSKVTNLNNAMDKEEEEDEESTLFNTSTSTEGSFNLNNPMDKEEDTKEEKEEETQVAQPTGRDNVGYYNLKQGEDDQWLPNIT